MEKVVYFLVTSLAISFGLNTDERVDIAGNHWVLIVAGSNGWYNYRHQADACHAYQIMKKHGIPANQIITMMFDDLAKNEMNPTPGVIINHPGGKDVYGGVKIDYKGKDVTPENFLSILSGDATAMSGIGTGRVIKSGPNDHVFVNFADHGAPGLIAFPEGELHAEDLMNTILGMYQKKQYQQMVLYIEACESGSMFDGLLPKNISVYATTAANPDESSYACYYDSARQTYLGDVYSVNWMEDSDQENLKVETLHKQFAIVKKETNTSHVMQYGTVGISDETVDNFQGGAGAQYINPEPYVAPKVPFDAVPSRDVPIAILEHRLVAAKTTEEQLKIATELKELLEIREMIDSSTHLIVAKAMSGARVPTNADMLHVRRPLRDMRCYRAVVTEYDTKCFDISKHDYALGQLYVFVNMCEERVPAQNIIDAIDHVCITEAKARI